MQPVAVAVKQEHAFGSTHVMIDPWSSAALSLNAARNLIPDEHLEATGKDVDPNHITIRFGLLNDDVDQLRSWIASQPPFEVEVDGIELFPASEHSDGAVPVVARMKGLGLHQLEDDIDNYADFKPKSFPVYKPHCTLAYCKPEIAHRYADLVVTGKCLVHSVTISHASGVQETIPFGMTQKWDAARHPRDWEGKFAQVGSVKVGDRDVQVVLPRRARNDKLVPLDVEKFDQLWKGDPSFYLSEGGGKNAIGNRYARFEDFITKNDSIEAAEVYINKEGEGVGFTNGRHRFAWLRDHGVKSIPVAMTEESVGWAKKRGLLVVQKWDESEHPRGAKGRFVEAMEALAKEYPDVSTFEEFEEAWAGGVADFGDPEAATMIQAHPGYYEYHDQLVTQLEQELGEKIVVYRAVSQDAHEDMEAGADLGPIGVTTDIELAKNWVKFAGNQNKELRILKTTIEPRIAVMRGKEAESEIVVDGNEISFGDWEEIGRATDKGGFVAKKFDEAQHPRDPKTGRFTDLGLHGDIVTVLHGTTRRNAEAILKEGFKPGNPARVAAQIEQEYGLPKDSILTHVGFQFARGRTDLDRVHFTTDEKVADQYSVPEVLQDALASAHSLLHPIPEDKPFTKELHAERKAWIDRESKRMTEPALLAVEIPFEEVGRHAWGKHMSMEEFNQLQDRFDVEDSIFNNIRIPISALTKAKISRRKWDESRHPRDKEGQFTEAGTVPETEVGKQIVGLIEDSGVGSDFVHALYDTVDPLDAIAGSFNLDTVRDADIEYAREVFKEKSQAMLRKKFPEGDIVAYRGVTGTEGKNDTISLTLDKNVALNHADRHARRLGEWRQFGEPYLGEVQEFHLRVEDILSYGEAIGRGTFAEEEILVRHKALVQKRQGKLWDESRHPRLPAGSGGRSGEFTETLHGPRDALDSLLDGEKNVSIDRNDVRRFLELAGEQLEDPDLTDLKVEGMQIFGGNGLGIERDDMPQIPREHRAGLLEYAQKRGVKIVEESVDPLTLKPTQNKISARRVAEKLRKYEKGGREFPPILVAQNGRVLDGHHHWGMMAAYRLDDPKAKVPIFRLKASTKEMLGIMHAYMKIHGLQRESLSGAKVAWDESVHPRNEQGRFVVYHGTDDQSAEGILRSGMKPGKTGVNWATTDLKSAHILAERRARDRGGKPVILEVTIPATESGKFNPIVFPANSYTGEPAYTHVTTTETIPSSWMKVHTPEKKKAWDEEDHPRNKVGQFVEAAIQRGEAHMVSEQDFVDYHVTGHIPSNAYERYEAGDMDFIHRKEFDTLLETREVNGKTVEIRLQSESVRYPKRREAQPDDVRLKLYEEYEQAAKKLGTSPMMAGIDLGRDSDAYKELEKLDKKWRDSGEDFVRDEKGDLIYLTPEEMKAKGLSAVAYTVGAFVGDKAIGYSGDEFGASGVYVAKDYQRHGLGLTLIKTFLEKSGRLAKGRQLGQMTYAGTELTRRLHRQLVKEAQAKKADPRTGRYVTPFVSFDKQGNDLLRMIASLNSSRLATWGFTAEAEVRGLARYRVTAVLDGRTSKFCRFIDGKIFDVTDAREKVIEALNVTDPEDLRSVQPWPSQSNAAMEAYEEMSAEELTDAGLHIPPYHPYCRTLLKPVQSSAGDLAPADVTETVPEGVEMFQPVTMADLQELGVEATQEQVDQWNAHVGMSPAELLSRISGVTPQEVLEKGVGANPIQFSEAGINFKARGEVAGVEFKLGALLDPFTGTYYLNYADLAKGSPQAEVKFLKRMFSELIGIGETSPTATALAVGVAGNAAYYAKLGFLPDYIEWDSIRNSALGSLDTTLKPVLASLKAEDQLLVRQLLQDQSVEALSTLVDLPFTYNGRTIGEWILGDIGGTWALDLLDEALMTQTKAYLT